jgi:amino acid permease
VEFRGHPCRWEQTSNENASFLLAVVCVIVGAMYYALPGGALPTFMPGYAADSTRIHMLHGFAAVTGAVVFLLIGLSTTPYHRQPRSPESV